MNPPVLVSVIIPVYNQKQLLADNIGSWLTQAYPVESYEIIIVDDGSTDDLREVVCKISNQGALAVRYCHQPHLGPAAARNLGVSQARGEIIAFSDADCRAEQNWVEEMSNGFTDEKVAGIGGLTKAAPTGSIVSQYCAYIKMGAVPVSKDGNIEYIITDNASFRRDCLILVGGFDERYQWAGGEEPDLCYRLRCQGYIFKHNHKAVVHNPHKQSIGALLKTFYCYGMGSSFLAVKKSVHCDWEIASFLQRAQCLCNMVCVCSWWFIKMLKFMIKFPWQIAIFCKARLGLAKATAYAFCDVSKHISYLDGCIVGYCIGQFKGLKRLHGNGLSKKNI